MPIVLDAMSRYGFGCFYSFMLLFLTFRIEAILKPKSSDSWFLGYLLGLPVLQFYLYSLFACCERSFLKSYSFHSPVLKLRGSKFHCFSLFCMKMNLGVILYVAFVYYYLCYSKLDLSG